VHSAPAVKDSVLDPREFVARVEIAGLRFAAPTKRTPESLPLAQHINTLEAAIACAIVGTRRDCPITQIVRILPSAGQPPSAIFRTFSLVVPPTFVAPC
jgi:hypothetical protein